MITASTYLEGRSSIAEEKGESLKRKGNVRRERNVRGKEEGVKEEGPRRRNVRKESRRGGTKLYDQNL